MAIQNKNRQKLIGYEKTDEQTGKGYIGSEQTENGYTGDKETGKGIHTEDKYRQ